MTRVRIRGRSLSLFSAQLGASGTGFDTDCFRISAWYSDTEYRTAGIFGADLSSSVRSLGMYSRSFCLARIAACIRGCMCRNSERWRDPRNLVSDECIPFLYYTDHYRSNRSCCVFWRTRDRSGKYSSSMSLSVHPMRELCRRSDAAPRM